MCGLVVTCPIVGYFSDTANHITSVVGESLTGILEALTILSE